MCRALCSPNHLPHQILTKPNTPPPDEAPPKATEEEGSVIVEGGELFSELQQKEEEAALNKSMETVEFSKPSQAEMLTGVSNFVVVDTSFPQQPSVVVLDEQVCVYVFT